MQMILLDRKAKKMHIHVCLNTFAAASEAVPPCLKRDHGARSSM